MANRRMFSKKIINSARFIKMPPSTQVLYFHLGLAADDDGIVEAFAIMRMVGCSEDDLKILVAKEFVKVLNDDLVTYILDWNEHNNIRSDRKVDSVYKSLLLQILPEVELIESKPRSDLKNNQDGRSTDGPDDSPRSGHGLNLDGLGKDRLGKDRLKEKNTKKENPQKNSFDFTGFTDKQIEAIEEWFEYRKQIKKPYKSQLTLDRLRNELLNNDNLIRDIQWSIAKGYQGVYSPDTHYNSQPRSSNHDLSNQPKTKDEMLSVLNKQGISVNENDLPF